MNDSFEPTIIRCRKYIAEGEKEESIINYLHQKDFTIIESIKAVRVLYNISLKDAKILVTNHPVWSIVVKNHEILHDHLEHFIFN